MATFVPRTRFMSVDLPTFGRPAKATKPARNSDFGTSLIASFSIARSLLVGCTLLGLVTATSCAGCLPPSVDHTRVFHDAEDAYRQGNYEAALTGYESFLKLYGESPLSETAKLRIRTIRREVDATLGSRVGIKPNYQKPTNQAQPRAAEETSETEPPAEESK